MESKRKIDLKSIFFWGLLLFITFIVILSGIPFELLRIKRKGKSMYRFIAYYWAKYSLLCTLTKYEIDGLDRFVQDKNYIIMGNHLSYFDIYLLFVALKDKIVFMAKKELFHLPFFGWVLKKMEFIPVDRDNPREAMKSLIEASKLLKSGDSILIFPEGTRSEDGNLQEFKQGGFILAKRSNLDILPFAIKNTNRVLKKDSLIINPGYKVSIKFLEPVETSGKKIADIIEVVREKIAKELNE